LQYISIYKEGHGYNTSVSEFDRFISYVFKLITISLLVVHQQFDYVGITKKQQYTQMGKIAYQQFNESSL